MTKWWSGHTWSRKQSAYVLILLALACAGYAFLVHRVDLGSIALTYGAILGQSRVPFARYIHGFPGAILCRRVLRSLIFFLPLFWLGFPALSLWPWGILIACGWSFCLLASQWKDLLFALDPSFIAVLSPLSKEERWAEALSPLWSALAQEYYYRGVVLVVFATYLGPSAILISLLLFVIEHLLQAEAARTFDTKDTIMHALLSLGLGVVMYVSHSLVGCIIGHALYNAPRVWEALHRRAKSRVGIAG